MEDHERDQMKLLIQQRAVRTQMGGKGKCGVYWAHTAKIAKLPYFVLLDILERCPHKIHPDRGTARACIELRPPAYVGRWALAHTIPRCSAEFPREVACFGAAHYRERDSNVTLILRSDDEWFSIGDVKALDPMKCFKRGGHIG